MPPAPPRLIPPDSWSGRSMAEHAAGLESACRAAMQLLEGRPDREAVLARIDPLPASARDLIRRLVQERSGG
jgi:hypothetical protein